MRAFLGVRVSVLSDVLLMCASALPQHSNLIGGYKIEIATPVWQAQAKGQDVKMYHTKVPRSLKSSS